MKFSLKTVLKQIVDFWKALSKKNKTIIISIAGVVVVFSVVTAIVLNMTSYVVLYSGLATSEASEISSRLSEMGVSSKTQSDGTILVPKNQEARLKMTLASEGYPQTTLNYDIFSQNSGFMTTDYEKKKYLIFQLQNRLQDAIKTISGIKNAIVTLGVPEENSYVLQSDQIPSTASVVLDLSAGLELTPKQISGIEELIAKSVPGLKTDNVAIVDNMGNILNQSSSTQVGSYARLDLEKNINTAVEAKVLKLLQPIFGSDSVRVAVNSVVDISKKVSEQTTYSPVVGNNGVISQQENSSEYSGSSSSAGGVVGTDGNTNVPTYPEGNTGDTGGSGSSSSNTSYLVNELKEQVERDGYEITDLSVAVVVNNKSLSQDQAEAYRNMVALASGISGDKVIVTNAEFLSSNNANPTVPSLSLSTELLLLAAAVVGSLILVIVLLLLLKRKKRKRRHADEDIPDDGLMDARLGKQSSQANQASQANQPKEDMPGEIVLSETREQGLKRQIREFTGQNPDIVAQLIRTWIKEGEDSDEQ